jgi:AcrR family transcriptional regulator
MARPRLISNEQIVQAMRACVLEHGPAVALDTVADQLGVTAPALLKRFGSRQALLIAALKPPDEPAWLGGLAAGPDGRPFAAQLLAHFEQAFAFFEEAVPCISALRESGVPAEQVLDLKKGGPVRALRALSAWLERAHAAGLIEVAMPETAATAMLGALQTRAFTSHVARLHYSARSNRAYLEELAELFARALKARPPSRQRKEPS